MHSKIDVPKKSKQLIIWNGESICFAQLLLHSHSNNHPWKALQNGHSALQFRIMEYEGWQVYLQNDN